MSAPLLREIEAKINLLSVGEKKQLLTRLVTDVRLETNAAFMASLAAMAADAEIQNELAQIQNEFAQTEADGLETL